jgi:hypothetical protein
VLKKKLSEQLNEFMTESLDTGGNEDGDAGSMA